MIFSFTIKYYKKVFPGLIILLVVNQYLPAQVSETESSKRWLLSIGVIGNKVIVIDKNFSAMAYSGITPGGSLSVKFEKTKASHELEAFYATGNLKTKNNPASDLNNKYLNIDYVNLYKINSATNTSFTYKIGGGLDVLYASRKYNNFINNNSSFEFAASISGVVQASYFFDNKASGFSITDRLIIPFVSSVAQPAFGSENTSGYITNSGSSAKAFLNSNSIQSFSNFFRIKNKISLDKNISTGQIISLDYTWDYYQLQNAREVKQANHRVGLTYSFII